MGYIGGKEGEEMRRQSVVFLLSMFLVLAATAIGQGKDGRMLVQDFTLTSSTGEEVSLSDFRGRIVVLIFGPVGAALPS